MKKIPSGPQVFLSFRRMILSKQNNNKSTKKEKKKEKKTNKTADWLSFFP